jgi:spectinomycin phosphotransferase
MLTPPAIANVDITDRLGEWYGLRLASATFLPIGQDEYSAVYRVEAADGAAYFLKLRRGTFDEVSVAVPAWLRAHGIAAVMAPLPTTAGRLWASAHGYTWLLYPFFDGANAYATPLDDAEWVAFGQALAAIHSANLPRELAALVPRERYPADLRERALALDAQVAAGDFDTPDDPPSAELARVWRARRDEIHAICARHAELACALAARADAFVLCHSDLHPANLLVGAGGALAIVDWDAPILAPRERDVMCIGGGMSAAWDDARAERLFRSGYGAAGADPLATAYYRYDRVVADLEAYGGQVFGRRGSLEDRAKGARQMSVQFEPGNVIAAAHTAYTRIG